MLQSLVELLGRVQQPGGTTSVTSVLRCPELSWGPEAEGEDDDDDAITAGLRARVRIYRRIQQAVRNELRAGQCGLWRNQSNSSGLGSSAADPGGEAGSTPAHPSPQQAAATAPTTPPLPGNVMMAAAIRMVLVMATQPSSDTGTVVSLCETLISLLRECPPDAVTALDDADEEEEEEEKKEHAKGTLQQLSGDRTLEAESFGRIARFARGKNLVCGLHQISSYNTSLIARLPQLPPTDMAGDANNPDCQHYALSLLVALGVTTGSVASLVDAAHRLLLLGADDDTQLLPTVASFLDRLAAEPATPQGPALAHQHGGDGFVGTSDEALALLTTSREQQKAMTMREAGMFILAHLDRLAAPFDVPPSTFGDPVEAQPSLPADAEPHTVDSSESSSGSTSGSEGSSSSAPPSSPSEEQQRQQRLPFRFDLRPLTFRRLLALVRAHLPYVPTTNEGSDDASGPYALLAGLRLLRVNVHHLARHHAARGVRLGPRALRLELLELVMALLDATAPDDEEVGPSSTSNALRAAIQREALALFIAGIEVFYPDGDAQARLLALHLRHHRASTPTPAAAAIRRLLLARLRDLPAMADLVEGATAPYHGGGEKAAAAAAAAATPPLPLYYAAARRRRGSGASGSSSSLDSASSGLLSLASSGSGSGSTGSGASPLSDLIHVLMKLSPTASIQALQGSQAAASTVATNDAPAILDTMLLYLIGRTEDDGAGGEGGDADMDAAAETMAIFLAALVPQAKAVLEVRMRICTYMKICIELTLAPTYFPSNHQPPNAGGRDCLHGLSYPKLYPASLPCRAAPRPVLGFPVGPSECGRARGYAPPASESGTVTGAAPLQPRTGAFARGVDARRRRAPVAAAAGAAAGAPGRAGNRSAATAGQRRCLRTARALARRAGRGRQQRHPRHPAGT